MIEQLCKLPLDCKLMIPRKKADVLSLSEFCVIVYVLVNVLAEFCALLMVAYLREPYLDLGKEVRLLLQVLTFRSLIYSYGFVRFIMAFEQKSPRSRT